MTKLMGTPSQHPYPFEKPDDTLVHNTNGWVDEPWVFGVDVAGADARGDSDCPIVVTEEQKASVAKFLQTLGYEPGVHGPEPHLFLVMEAH